MNKTKRFLSISRVAKIVTIVATLCSFKITALFSFMKAKKSPSDLINFFLFWPTLKTFDIKQGSLKFCIIIESKSQKTFFTIVLYTNMATVTSHENREYTYWEKPLKQ